MFSVPSWALTFWANVTSSSAVLIRILVSLALLKNTGLSTVALSRSVAIIMRWPEEKSLSKETLTSLAVLSSLAFTDLASAIATMASSALLPVTS